MASITSINLRLRAVVASAVLILLSGCEKAPTERPSYPTQIETFVVRYFDPSKELGGNSDFGTSKIRTQRILNLDQMVEHLKGNGWNVSASGASFNANLTEGNFEYHLSVDTINAICHSQTRIIRGASSGQPNN